MAEFSFFRTSSGRHVGLISHYKAVISRDVHTGRRHIKVFDRTAFITPLRYQNVATSTEQAKRLCNDWLQGRGV